MIKNGDSFNTERKDAMIHSTLINCFRRKS